MHALSVIHGANAGTAAFGEVLREAGHEVDEWSLAWAEPPPSPVDEYDAVLVFGGSMHADQDDRHPWLREETLFLQRILDAHQPVLGVCLGAQLLARAAHASVLALEQPEIGWHEVELTPEAEDDPVVGGLPKRFAAFQWHYYTYELPAGAVELARSRACTQAFRLGARAWGVQFHPEVSADQVRSWLADEDDAPADAARIVEETAERIEEWQQLGRRMCLGFVEAAVSAQAPR